MAIEPRSEKTHEFQILVVAQNHHIERRELVVCDYMGEYDE